MLPKQSRVKKDLFPKIMKEGVFLHSLNFYVRYLPHPTPLKLRGASFFSFVVPNKVIKTSVGRHLLKRKMSAVVEKLLIAQKPSISAVIFSKKDVSKVAFEEVEKEITELLKKAL